MIQHLEVVPGTVQRRHGHAGHLGGHDGTLGGVVIGKDKAVRAQVQFGGDVGQFIVRKPVFGVGVERDMDDRFFGANVRGHPSEQLVGEGRDTEASVGRKADITRRKHRPFAPIDLTLIVSERPVDVLSGGDIGYHRCRNASARVAIFAPTATNSRVSFSNL